MDFTQQLIAMPEAIRLRQSFDPDRMMAELGEATSRPWGKQRIYTADGVGVPTDIDWRVLALRSLGGDADRTDPGGPGPTGFAPTAWLEQMPYLASIINAIPAPLNAVRLMALGPGAVSTEHRDPKYSLYRGIVRLHVPLVTNPDALLILDGVAHCWQPGEFWFGDFSRAHKVQNHGTQSRVHMVIDALLTPELAGLFPTPWQDALTSGDVLLNRPTARISTSSVLASSCITLPSAFTDFDHDDALNPPEPATTWHLAQVEDHLMLLQADEPRFVLAHVGDGEYRFSGWSEQRTIQLLPDGAVLRVRHGRTQQSLTVAVSHVQAL